MKLHLTNDGSEHKNCDNSHVHDRHFPLYYITFRVARVYKHNFSTLHSAGYENPFGKLLANEFFNTFSRNEDGALMRWPSA